ncbi:MAG: hypothetical protein AAF928_17370 [Myxococcota bacterium]
MKVKLSVSILSLSLAACSAAQFLGVATGATAPAKVTNQTDELICAYRTVNPGQGVGEQMEPKELRVGPRFTEGFEFLRVVKQSQNIEFLACDGRVLSTHPVPPLESAGEKTDEVLEFVAK